MNAMERNKQQKAAIFSQKPLIAVSAGAGSGKTSVLTERYRFILEEKLSSSSFGADVKEIVALTFTEKAAREMRNRIRHQIENRVETTTGETQLFWKKQLQDFEQATISTFHSFCMKLLKDFSFEAGVYPDFELMDDLKSTQLKNKIICDILDHPDDQEKWETINRYYSRSTIKGLVTSIYGKMREFETPIQYWLTGENRLKQNDLEQLIDDLKGTIEVQIEKFMVVAKKYRSEFPQPETITKASAVQAKLREISALIDSPKPSTMTWYQEMIKLSVPATAERHAPALYQFYKEELLPFKEFMNLQHKQLTSLKKQQLSPEQIEMLNEILTVFSDVVQKFNQAYSREKRALNVLDFSDLQQKAISLLEHKHIQQICQQQYKHFLLDEFQDTNHLQMSLLEKIQPLYQFIVGDGKQSIYRFRGADVGLIKQVSQAAKKDKENGEYINLFVNYRTCSSIIDFVNLTFQQLLKVEPTEAHLPYKIEYEKLESYRNSDKEQENRVELFEAAEKEMEYQFIANRIVEMKSTKQEIFDKKTQRWRSVDWFDIAILIPTRTNLLKLERALQNKNIPYTVYGGLGFYDQPEVIDMMMLLQWLNRPFEELYIFALLKSPLFGLSLEDLYKLKQASEKEVVSFIYEEKFLEHPSLNENIRSNLRKLSSWYQQHIPFIVTTRLKERLRLLFRESGLETVCLLHKNNVQRVRNVEKLIDILDGFNTSSLEEMLNRLSVIKDLSDKEGNAEVELSDDNSLHIMTVHASKGLEFPVVFVTNINGTPRPDSGDIRFDETSGLVAKCKIDNQTDILAAQIAITPGSFTEADLISKKQAEEEWKRLFYVAVTRARDYLVLTGHGKGKGSWLEQLNKAMEMDETLLGKIKLIESFQDVGKILHEKKVYKLPQFQEREEPPISFSVSEVMSYLHDPVSYYMKHVLKLDINLNDEETQKEYDEWPEQNKSRNFKATVLGTLVHRACELLDIGLAKKEAIERTLSEILASDEEEGLYNSQLETLLENYQWKQKSLGDPVANEWNFTLNLEGVYLIGEIDKIVKAGNDLQVIDLKTNFISEENTEQLIQYYKPQLYLYKLAYEHQMNLTINKMSLFFLRDKDNGIYDIPYENQYEEYLREKIREMASL